MCRGAGHRLDVVVVHAHDVGVHDGAGQRGLHNGLLLAGAVVLREQHSL